MRQVILASFLSCLIIAISGCQLASKLGGVWSEDISEIGRKLQTGLSGASADLVVRRDGSAELTCNFYGVGEEDLREDSIPVNAIAICGKRFKSARHSFVKTQYKGVSDYIRGISKAAASREQFSRVADLIVRNGYFSMNDRYEIPGLLDAPPDITRVVYSGGEKTVSNQGGRGGPKLNEIEEAMANELEWR